MSKAGTRILQSVKNAREDLDKFFAGKKTEGVYHNVVIFRALENNALKNILSEKE